MKLRNKKTGEIQNVWTYYEKDKDLNIKYFTDDGVVNLEYDSLAELNEEWEDYKPAEPLIKDEKTRKVFREWAGFFGTERFRVNHFFDWRRKTTSIGSTDLTTEPSIELPGHIGEDSQIYTITELCGEEE